jgi:hypothetical protein
MRKVLISLYLAAVLYEGIQPFVHPGPLTLIVVDDHRKEVVPYFMND